MDLPSTRNVKILPAEDPLCAAILQEDVQELEHLLLQGAPVNYKVPRTSNTPLMIAVGPSPTHTLMVQHLLDHQARVDVGESFHGITPLMAACNVGNYKLAELLLRRGAKVNAQSADGKTALIRMARKGNLNIVKLLLQWGAELHVFDEQAKNALMYACSENQIHVVKYLLQPPTTEANVGVNEYKVDTPLWHACAAGHADIVRLLVEEGNAKIEYRLDGTIYSTTPLMEACEWGHLAVVQILLEHGASVTSRTGRKALLLAQRSGYQEVVQLMEFWQKRLVALESLLEPEGPLAAAMENDTTAAAGPVPVSLIPVILSLVGKRPDLTHRILNLRVDILLSCGV